MLRLLSNGYTRDDFKFMAKTLRKAIREVHEQCLDTNERCIYCEHRRACLDILEVTEFVEKGGDR